MSRWKDGMERIEREFVDLKIPCLSRGREKIGGLPMILWKMIKILLNFFLESGLGRRQFFPLDDRDQGSRRLPPLSSRVGFCGVKEGQHQPPSSHIRLVFSTHVPKNGSFLLFYPLSSSPLI